MIEPLACCLHGVERRGRRARRHRRDCRAGPDRADAVRLRRRRRRAAGRRRRAARSGALSRRSFGAVAGRPEGADVVIEAAGTVEAWERALALVRPGGTVARLRRPAARRARRRSTPTASTTRRCGSRRLPSRAATRPRCARVPRQRRLPVRAPRHARGRAGGRRRLVRRSAARLPQGRRAAVILSTRRLNRALLARQLLLERSRMPIGRALERVAGLQAQYAPSPYIRLWSLLEGFERGDLTARSSGGARSRATLMRSHDPHRLAARLLALRGGRRAVARGWWLRTHGPSTAARDIGRGRARRCAASSRAARGSGRSSTSCSRRRARRSGPAPGSTWCACRRRARGSSAAPTCSGSRTSGSGRDGATEDDGLEHLLRRYLARLRPGVARGRREAGRASTARSSRPSLERTRAAEIPRRGRQGAARPAPCAAARRGRAGTRAVPRHLGRDPARPRTPHADPARAVPAARVLDTKNPQSVQTFLVDGAVAGSWRVERAGGKATLRLEPFEPLPRQARDEVRDEAERLVRFHEPDGTSYAVR